MSILKNKKGLGIATVIGIVTFVLALVTTLFIVTVNQATLIKKSQDNLELVSNYTDNLISASSIIENDPSILDDSIKRAALSSLLNITMEQAIGYDYWILKNNDLEKGLTSYLTYLPPGSGGFVELVDFLISETDLKNSVPGIYSIPHDFHISAASAFYNEFIFDLTGVNPAVSTFADIMTHAAANKDNSKIIYYKPEPSKTYTINPNTFPTDTIPTDTILVVDGSITVNSNFNGIVFARDNITVNKPNGLSMDGSFYVGGSFIGHNNTQYASEKNSFIFADSFSSGGAQSGTNDPINTLYTFSNALTFNSNGSFTGGFFTDIQNDINVKNTSIKYRALTNPFDGVPLNLFIEIPGTGGSVGEGQILSTYPRKE